jgi:hypothetical protein
MTAVLFILLSTLDRIIVVVRQSFRREPAITMEQFTAAVEKTTADVRQRYETAIETATAAAVEHATATLRHDREVEILRVLVNRGLVRLTTRVELNLIRN